jgi:hypothetical protein
MGVQRFRVGGLILFLVYLIQILASVAWGQEILVKDVPYIVQKAHID